MLIAASVWGLAESTGPNGSNAQAVHALGERGDGVNIGLISAGNLRRTHEAFGDPCVYDATDDGISVTNHDTWVAGVAVSRGGVANPNDLGVAPEAEICSARVVNDSSQISTAFLADALNKLVNDWNCRVMFSGIALGLTPDGNSHWTMLYDYYAYEYDVVFANPAGNVSSTIQPFGDAYNGITIGGLSVTEPNIYRQVGTSSGQGLTTDGRRKPEVAAPSQFQTMPSAGSDTSWFEVISAGGLTSFSTPHVAGVAALLLGLADDTGDGDDNQGEVIRAVIINSAFPNIRDRSGVSTTLATYNDQRGYGRVDALRAYQTLGSAQVTPGTINETRGWAFENIASAGQHTYTINASRRERLLVTLVWDRRMVWTDAKTGFPPKFNGLIDDGELSAFPVDLDLEIYEPGNPTAVFGGLATNDNVEKVDLLLATTGTYTIKVVNNSGSESPDYALAFEVLEPLPGDADLDYTVDSDDMIIVLDQWLATGVDLDGDVYPDGSVDLLDFDELDAGWMLTDQRYFPY